MASQHLFSFLNGCLLWDSGVRCNCVKSVSLLLFCTLYHTCFTRAHIHVINHTTDNDQYPLGIGGCVQQLHRRPEGEVYRQGPDVPWAHMASVATTDGRLVAEQEHNATFIILMEEVGHPSWASEVQNSQPGHVPHPDGREERACVPTSP